MAMIRSPTFSPASSAVPPSTISVISTPSAVCSKDISSDGFSANGPTWNTHWPIVVMT